MALAPPREIRVLVVDDAEPGRKMLIEVLSACSAIRIAEQAADGLSGFALAAKLQPDLVITDLHLPGRDGFQLTALLRQQYPAMRSIIVSVDDTPTCQAASRLNGADGFVSKWRLLQDLPPLLAALFPDGAEPATAPCDP